MVPEPRALPYFTISIETFSKAIHPRPQMVQVSEGTLSTLSETDQIDSDLYAATAVPSVWTQQTADSNYAVAVESGEGIIESGTTKKYVAPALYYG